MNATDVRPQSIPRAQGGLPVVGHGLAFLRDPYKFLNSLPAQGDIVDIEIGPKRVAMVCNPDLVYAMLRSDRVFDKGGLLIERGRELLGNGLATCPHSDHRRQRRLLQPAFHQSCMPGYGLVISEQIGTVLDNWRDGQTLDMIPAMKQLTTRITAAALFTTALPPEKLTSMAEDIETFSAGVFRRMVLPPLLSRVPTPGNIRYNRANRRVKQTIAEIIAEYRANGIDHGGLLPILMASRDTESAQQQLSDAECVDQAVTMFFAGIETAAISLSWALHTLAEDPRLCTRLYSEVDEVLSGRIATPDDLPALSLTSRIVTETFRMCSPTWLITRVVTTDTQLGGYQLAAGKVVGCSPLMTHHDPKVHRDPDRFDPDRWLDAGASRAAPLFLFGSGARKCIGDNLAAVETTLALASIISRWHIESVPSGMPRPRLHVFHIPKNLKIKIAARQNH